MAITLDGTVGVTAAQLTATGAGVQFSDSSVLQAVPRSYISGLTLSTAGSSATMSIAAGMGVNSTNVQTMILTSAISKTTSAWAVGTGNGGLDTGAIANSTWYYFYLIRRTDTGVVDVVFSTNSTSPTLPAGYTQFRYIGAGRTNGSAQWTAFTQFGDEFWWSSPPLDYDSPANISTAVLLTCSAPLGRKMKLSFNALAGQAGNYLYISDPANADLAPSITVAPLANGSGFATTAGTATAGSVWTNTSAQVRIRCNTAGGTNVKIVTLGWVDLRGKDL